MDKSNYSDMLPRRRLSASKTAPSFVHQLGSDGSSGLEVEEDVVDKLSTSPRGERAKVKMKYGKKSKLRARTSSMKGSIVPTTICCGSSSSDAILSPSGIASTSSHRNDLKSTDKKGLVLRVATDSSLITESDLSDLTPISSSTRSSSPGITSPIEDIPKPPLCIPPKVVPLGTRLGPKCGHLAKLHELAWSANDLDSYVWVLLEPKSKRVYDPDGDGNDYKERLWWPAKIQSARSTDIPLKVSLFGPGSKRAEIETPSVANVLPKLDVIGRPRFNNPTFVSAPSVALNTPMASPRKKLRRDRGDVEKNWEAAVWEMMQDGEEQAGSDHLPDIGEAFIYHFDVTFATTAVKAPVGIPTNMGKGKNKGKGKRTCESDDEGFWEPPPADEGLDIPGELVLGRDRALKTAAYWPAKIKNYVPPTKRTEQCKYTVIWLDASEQNIPRDWFYTTDEDGFALCTLGKFESSIPEVVNDDEEEKDEDHGRSSSPVPLDPPPGSEDFLNLSVREQFVYTKTILHAILNDKYEPARSKHSRFMEGGKQRASLTDEAALRGRVGPKDVEHLQTYIQEWCLREEAPVNTFVDESENHVNDSGYLGATKNIRDEIRMPLLDLSVEITNDLRSGSPALTESSLLSSPRRVPPSSSCLSITVGCEASPISDDSFVVPTAPLSALESEALPYSATTNPIPSNTTLGSTGRPLKHVKARQAKQQGCEEYELLSHLDKIEYCLNILLPEAVRQILLWRSGKRTSIELLSSAEEEDLYQEGQTLLNETDWVFDILRYRQMKQRILQSKIPKGKKNISRPRRGLNAPNYVE